jgi:hypothetical protein
MMISMSFSGTYAESTFSFLLKIFTWAKIVTFLLHLEILDSHRSCMYLCIYLFIYSLDWLLIYLFAVFFSSEF